MRYDFTTKEGVEAAKKWLKETREKRRFLIDMAKEDVDSEPVGKMTNPSEFQIQRIKRGLDND